MARGGMQYVFVMLDAFTEYINLYPLRKATVRMCLKRIMGFIIPKFGKPKRILPDHDSQFTYALWKKRLENEGIKVLYSSTSSVEFYRVMRKS